MRSTYRPPPGPHRRRLLLGAASLLLAAGCAQAAPARELVVFKTPYCGCCNGWITHMRRAGFNPVVRVVDDLNPVRAQYGVPFKLSSCHTAVAGRYVIEGHVPPADVARLLAEKPNAVGLTVPGMPIGSPGMESPSGEMERFATLLLLDRAGRTRVFAHHG